jgi:hypothetical protein
MKPIRELCHAIATWDKRIGLDVDLIINYRLSILLKDEFWYTEDVLRDICELTAESVYYEINH